MRRGEIVTIALQGDYGKPRPALVVQSDVMAALDSVIVCPMTSLLTDADFRITIEPNPLNGLNKTSQLMADKPMTLPKAKVGAAIGQLDDEKMKAVNRALLLAFGID